MRTEVPLPDLDPSRVLKSVVGLRPYRRGSIRLETEQMGEKLVAHNYGHGGSGITLCWGTARWAVESLEIPADSPVAVLGAGAVGLCSATLLAERGYQVKVYAADFPPNTTSNVAGGLWAPTHIAVGQEPHEQARHKKVLEWSWGKFEELVDSELGVNRVKLYEAHDSPHPLEPMPAWLTGPGQFVDRLPFGPKAPPGTIWNTFLVETPRFLEGLMTRLRTTGVEFEKRTFNSKEELQALPQPTLVNCLGLGAGELLHDRAVMPIRGQLVCLKPASSQFILDHSGGYMISRRDMLVLGGTFEEGASDLNPCPRAAERILQGNRFLTL